MARRNRERATLEGQEVKNCIISHSIMQEACNRRHPWSCDWGTLVVMNRHRFFHLDIVPYRLIQTYILISNEIIQGSNITSYVLFHVEFVYTHSDGGKSSLLHISAYPHIPGDEADNIHTRRDFRDCGYHKISASREQRDSHAARPFAI